MQNKTTRSLLLFFLSVVFSIALMFAFIELPVWLDSILQQRVGFPGMDQGADETSRYLTDLWIDAFYLRWIGYISLAMIVLFIILGFVTKRSGWAWAGALTLFLPVFGQFALSMFFLSGLGVLRAGWLPFMDISWNVLDLGNVIYIPYWILMWFFSLFGWYAHHFISWVFMASGAFLFVWGVMEWFSARFGEKGVAIRAIYRFTRHPQYLGWILWSYGYMLFSAPINNMKKSWGVSSSLPWLLMTMIIVAICLLEELKMQEKYGDEYDSYRQKTPFLFPLPFWLKEFVRLPARILIHKKAPRSGGDILKITGVYTLGLILASLPWVEFSPKKAAEAEQEIRIVMPPDSVMKAIHIPGQGRRDYDRHISGIRDRAANASALLMELAGSPLPEVREFSVYALGRLDCTDAIPLLIPMIHDEHGRVRNAAIQTLGKLHAKEAGPVLVNALNDPEYGGYRNSLYHALADIGTEEAVPLLIEGLSRPPWYHQAAAINSLYDIDPDTAFHYLVLALQDTLREIRRNAVMMMLKDKRPEAVAPLEGVVDDEDFETRFYARQTIRLIESGGQ